MFCQFSSDRTSQSSPKVKHYLLQQRSDGVPWEISNKLSVFSMFLLYYHSTFVGFCCLKCKLIFLKMVFTDFMLGGRVLLLLHSLASCSIIAKKGSLFNRIQYILKKKHVNVFTLFKFLSM